jgi:tRNA (Thr-GGU) A37 N-methylase
MLFATRAPHRPNQLALSAVEITGVDLAAGRIHVKGLDLLDGTPVLDIKPYLPFCDSFPEARAGWIDELPGAPDGPDHLNYYPPPAHLRKQGPTL